MSSPLAQIAHTSFNTTKNTALFKHEGVIEQKHLVSFSHISQISSDQCIEQIAALAITIFGEFQFLKKYPVTTVPRLQDQIGRDYHKTHKVYTLLSDQTLFEKFKSGIQDKSAFKADAESMESVADRVLSPLSHLSMPIEKIKLCNFSGFALESPSLIAMRKSLNKLLDKHHKEHAAMVDKIFQVIDKKENLALNSEEEEGLQSFLFSKTALIERDQDKELRQISWHELLQMWSVSRKDPYPITELYQYLPLQRWILSLTAQALKDIRSRKPVKKTLRKDLIEHSLQNILQELGIQQAWLPPYFLKDLKAEWKKIDHFRTTVLFFAFHTAALTQHDDFTENDSSYVHSFSCSFIKSYEKLRPLIEKKALSCDLMKDLFSFCLMSSEADRRAGSNIEDLLLRSSAQEFEGFFFHWKNLLSERVDICEEKLFYVLNLLLELRFFNEGRGAKMAALIGEILSSSLFTSVHMKEELFVHLLLKAIEKQESFNFIEVYAYIFNTLFTQIDPQALQEHPSAFFQVCVELFDTVKGLQASPLKHSEKAVREKTGLCMSLFKAVCPQSLSLCFCHFILKSLKDEIPSDFIYCLKHLNLSLMTQSPDLTLLKEFKQESRLSLLDSQIFNLYNLSVNFFSIKWDTRQNQFLKILESKHFLNELKEEEITRHKFDDTLLKSVLILRDKYALGSWEISYLYLGYSNVKMSTLDVHLKTLSAIEAFINCPLDPLAVSDWLCGFPSLKSSQDLQEALADIQKRINDADGTGVGLSLNRVEGIVREASSLRVLNEEKKRAFKTALGSLMNLIRHSVFFTNFVAASSALSKDALLGSSSSQNGRLFPLSPNGDLTKSFYFYWDKSPKTKAMQLVFNFVNLATQTAASFFIEMPKNVQEEDIEVFLSSVASILPEEDGRVVDEPVKNFALSLQYALQEGTRCISHPLKEPYIKKESKIKMGDHPISFSMRATNFKESIQENSDFYSSLKSEIKNLIAAGQKITTTVSGPLLFSFDPGPYHSISLHYLDQIERPFQFHSKCGPKEIDGIASFLIYQAGGDLV